jgi:hypothetical protein
LFCWISTEYSRSILLFVLIYNINPKWRNQIKIKISFGMNLKLQSNPDPKPSWNGCWIRIFVSECSVMEYIVDSGVLFVWLFWTFCLSLSLSLSLACCCFIVGLINTRLRTNILLLLLGEWVQMFLLKV